MKRHRLWMAALAAGLIIVIGLFWNQGTFNQQSPESIDNDRRVKGELADFDGEDWEVSPEARMELDTDTTPERDYSTFQIPGQLIFPEGTENRQTDVQLRVRPIRPERAEKLSNSSSNNLMRELFKGGLDQALERSAFEQTVRTDSNGNFSIEEALPGIYEVTLSDTRWTITNNEPRIELPDQIQPLRYEVSPTGKLNGRVEDPEGNPLEAMVAHTDGSDSFSTDNQGQFSVNGLSSEEEIDDLVIYREGYIPHFVNLSAPEPGSVIEETFTLQLASKLQVRVLNQDDEPVTTGKVILERNDDKTIQYGSRQSVPHGEGKIAELNENGVAVFESLQPGEVVFGLTFSDHLSSKKSVSVQAGETQEVTHRVTEGIPVNLTFIDESSGEPARDIEPAIRAYDDDGNELSPSFELTDQTGPGEYEGVVHPAIEEIRMKITSPMHTYKEKEVRFNRNQFPDLEVQVVPSERRTPPGGGTPPGLVQLNLQSEGTSVDWDQIENARLEVLDATTGERVYSRTGGSAVFSERLPLGEGSYVLYGRLIRDGTDMIVYEELSITSQNPGERTLSAVPAASVEGQVNVPDGSSAGLRVGISLLPSDGGASDTTIPFYPEGLSMKLSEDGRYNLTNLPAKTSLRLQVLSTSRDELDRDSGRVIEMLDVEGIPVGEQRTLPSVSVNNRE